MKYKFNFEKAKNNNMNKNSTLHNSGFDAHVFAIPGSWSAEVNELASIWKEVAEEEKKKKKK